LGNKLDEINKNIQIEKKKLRNTNLTINDVLANQLMNNKENSRDFLQKGKTGNKIRGKSEIDVNMILNRNIINKQLEMNSMNILNNNIQNLNDFKFVKNKR